MTEIENLITPKILNKLIANRMQVRNAVFDEQGRQFYSGEYDPIKLAHVSKYHTDSKKSTRQIEIMAHC